MIAAMAPSTSTVESFWKMILENNVTLIVQLCPEIENNKVRIIEIELQINRRCVLSTMSRRMRVQNHLISGK